MGDTSSSLQGRVERPHTMSTVGQILVAPYFPFLTAIPIDMASSRNEEQWRYGEINICVTGDSGVGKSSFINTIRGLADDDDLAAKTGGKETTRKMAVYPHPTNPKIKFWNSLSMVTADNPNWILYHSYGEFVSLAKYDIFLIFTAGRFTENDLALAKTLKNYNRSFFLVRTKIDQDYASMITGIGEEVMLNAIRQCCWENLQGMRTGDEDVFLISNHYPTKWDFARLTQAILDVLPPPQRESLEMALSTLRSQQKEELHRDVFILYNSDEHDLIGTEAGYRNIHTQDLLTLPNGIQLTYGQIIALAGDFYGVPDSPIIEVDVAEYSVQKRRERFLEAYATLAVDPSMSHRKEVYTLVKMIQDDDYVRETGNGTYHTNEEWDKATRERWNVSGRMLKLAVKNFDHFQPQAKQAYLVGHRLAMEKAREAGRENDVDVGERKLMEACSMEAFAAHYLTDSFSAGHIRTPRVALPNKVRGPLVGHRLSQFMHDEDCKFGIRVRNGRGDEWIAYGDGNLVKNGNRRNFELVKGAVRISLNEVREVFLHPERLENPTCVTDLLPFVDSGKKNNSPLFQMKDDGKLHRRSDIEDLQDKETVAGWWGWWGTTTASELEFYHPKNSALPLP